MQTGGAAWDVCVRYSIYVSFNVLFFHMCTGHYSSVAISLMEWQQHLHIYHNRARGYQGGQ